MNELFFLVFSLIFLIFTLYLAFERNKWGIATLLISIMFMLLYFFLPSKDDSTTKKENDSTTKKENDSTPEDKTLKFFTFQSPTLRNTFNYINMVTKDESTGRLEYGGDSNMTRWGIPVKEYTHVKFPNGYLFKLRTPSSSDSYGFFIDEKGNKIKAPDNFFSDFIKIGSYSK